MNAEHARTHTRTHTHTRERSGSVVECFTRDRGGRGFDPHRHHCIVFLSRHIYPSLVLVQHRKTRPYITEILLMGRKESIKRTHTHTLARTHKRAHTHTRLPIY